MRGGNLDLPRTSLSLVSGLKEIKPASQGSALGGPFVVDFVLSTAPISKFTRVGREVLDKVMLRGLISLRENNRRNYN